MRFRAFPFPTADFPHERLMARRGRASLRVASVLPHRQMGKRLWPQAVNELGKRLIFLCSILIGVQEFGGI